MLPPKQSSAVSLLENAKHSHEKLRKTIDRTWQELDIEDLGVLDKISAFRFVNKVLKEVKGEGNFCVTDFD